MAGCTTFTALLHDKFLRPTPGLRAIDHHEHDRYRRLTVARPVPRFVYAKKLASDAAVSELYDRYVKD